MSRLCSRNCSKQRKGVEPNALLHGEFNAPHTPQTQSVFVWNIADVNRQDTHRD